jgi:hypothetical protein
VGEEERGEGKAKQPPPDLGHALKGEHSKRASKPDDAPAPKPRMTIEELRIFLNMPDLGRSQRRLPMRFVGPIAEFSTFKSVADTTVKSIPTEQPIDGPANDATGEAETGGENE